MRLSQYFLPTLKEDPAEAQVISHRLMLRAGMIQQTASGIYSWLPLGHRVLYKVEALITQEMDRAGCHKVTLPTLQSADLWKESGRYDVYGKEMLRLKDRHERDLLYTPTAEELITHIFQSHIKSYKHFPQVLYQIQWKFRDEIRPRFGVMRGREFLMKDAYSFDLDPAAAKKTYERMYEAYLKTFAAMDLIAIPVRADTGPIGGDLSHEFHVMAPTGESTIYYDAAFETISPEKRSFRAMSSLYSAADEMHDPSACPLREEELRTSRGIEIGHIFYFGAKYTQALKCTVMDKEGAHIFPEMGSYGIGVSRLVAALIEVNHDESGIIWPKSVAPFHVALLNLKSGDATTDALCEKIYAQLKENAMDVLYDDRKERAGTKFADADLVGLPLQLIVGPKGAAQGEIEIKVRKTNERLTLKIEDGLTWIQNWMKAS